MSVAPLVPTIGASTAIYGLFGAISIDRLHSGGLGDPFLRNMAIILVINLVFSFSIKGISWQGHIGGLIGGVVCMEALARFGKKDAGRRLGGGDVLGRHPGDSRDSVKWILGRPRLQLLKP